MPLASEARRGADVLAVATMTPLVVKEGLGRSIDSHNQDVFNYWDDSDKSSFSGYYTCHVLSTKLAAASPLAGSSPCFKTRRLRAADLCSTPGCCRAPTDYTPSLCLAKSSSKELQPQHFIMARKQGRRAPVAAVIKMLTETQAKCTKCFTISKANVMYFFLKTGGGRKLSAMTPR